MQTTWDCLVVGGGASGLSAALVLGRARRRTLVIDAGSPSNRVAHGIGGLLGNDTRAPADFYAAGRAELAAYPSVEVRDGEVVGGERTDAGFALELADGTRELARTVLLATGMDYRYAPVPGLDALWGRSVFHCPFCHGWEVRDERLGVLDRGAIGAQRALLLRAWSDDVVLLSDGPAELDAEQAAVLDGAGVQVDERPVARVRAEDEALAAVVLADGDERPLGGLLVPVTLHQRSHGLAAQLGATLTETGLAPDAVQTDARFATTVPGLFAAGDVNGQMPSVANAIMAGANAAAMIVHALVVDAPQHVHARAGAGSR